MLAGREADVLNSEPDLLEGHDLVLVRGPVLVTLGGVLLYDPVEHDDGPAALLPDHAPEVRGGGGQRALGQHIGPAQRLQAEQAGVDVVSVGDIRERNPTVVIRIHIPVSANI